MLDLICFPAPFLSPSILCFAAAPLSDLAGEVFVAPATAGVDINFLEQCMKMGLLDGLDGVSVHAYRTSEPESVIPVRSL